MKAGRELDILIGEKIFGVKHTWIAQGYYQGEPVGGLIECEMAVKNYSTDIAAAFEIVNHFCKNEDSAYSPEFELETSTHKGDGTHTWIACFYDRFSKAGFREAMNFGHAQTAPLAICIAALKAIGHDL